MSKKSTAPIVNLTRDVGLEVVANFVEQGVAAQAAVGVLTADVARPPQFERIPIEQLEASTTNPRTSFPDEYLRELAASIADKGVLQPILVRPRGAGFEVVAGECRLRASRLAGLMELPAMVQVLSDDAVLEIQLIENIQRRDLTPLEHAAGFRALIDSNPDKHSAESIGARLKKSPAWVWDRMKLLDLVPEAQALLRADRMSAGHAILIARLASADQQRVIAATGPKGDRPGLHVSGGLWTGERTPLLSDDRSPYAGLKAVSVRELDVWIKNHVRFDASQAGQADPFRYETTAQQVEAVTGKVTPPPAGARPGAKTITRAAVVPITFDPHVGQVDGKPYTYGPLAWRLADGSKKNPTCDLSVLGVVTVGTEHYGETRQVCVAREGCRVHWKAEIVAHEKALRLRAAGKTKQAAAVTAKAARDRQATLAQQQARWEAERDLWTKLEPVAVKAVIAKVKPRPLNNALLADVVAEQARDAGSSGAEVVAYLGGPITAQTFGRALGIVDVLRHDVNLSRFQKIARRYKVNLRALAKTVIAPTPKTTTPAAAARTTEGRRRRAGAKK